MIIYIIDDFSQYYIKDKNFMLDKKITDLIDSKAKDINKNPHKYHKDFSKRIKKLEDYINGYIKLDDIVIENILVNLLQATVFLDIPLPKGTNIVRARKYDLDPEKLCFESVNDLSYIPQEKKVIIPVGRMNREKESMFYGCLSKDDNNIGTVFSEIDSNVNDTVCVLESAIKTDLFVRPIGIFSYYSSATNVPWEIHPSFKEMYHYFQKVFSKKSMEVVNKCDTFFATILKKEKSDRLYNVTSKLASICMEGSADGIIYPSVRGDNAPNLVIKPDSIDTKVIHKEVRSFLITENLGDALYRAKVLQQFPIEYKIV